jgi:hypothetical protein
MRRLAPILLAALWASGLKTGVGKAQEIEVGPNEVIEVEIGGVTAELAVVTEQMAAVPAPDLAPAPDPGPAPASAPPPARMNLLSPKNGGALLAAPSPAWSQTADDEEGETERMETGEEAVYGFLSERSATFDTFAVLINQARGSNPEKIELLAGDEGPTGHFDPIAICTFKNLELAGSPYQLCRFVPVTARYLKVRLLAAFSSDYVTTTEFQLLGEIAL